MHRPVPSVVNGREDSEARQDVEDSVGDLSGNLLLSVIPSFMNVRNTGTETNHERVRDGIAERDDTAEAERQEQDSHARSDACPVLNYEKVKKSERKQ